MNVYVYIKKFHFLVARKTQMMRSSCETVITPNLLNQLAHCRQRTERKAKNSETLESWTLDKFLPHYQLLRISSLFTLIFNMQ